jgi:hypothetical protein
VDRAVREQGGDFGVGCDDGVGVGQGLGLGAQKGFGPAKVRQAGAIGMGGGGFVQTLVEDGRGQAGHQHREGAAAEEAVLPEKGQKRLRDRHGGDVGGELACQSAGDGMGAHGLGFAAEGGGAGASEGDAAMYGGDFGVGGVGETVDRPAVPAGIDRAEQPVGGLADGTDVVLKLRPGFVDQERVRGLGARVQAALAAVHVAARYAAGGAEVGGRGGRVRAGRCWGGGRLAGQGDGQVGFVEAHAQSHRGGRDEAQIDVIPGDGGIAAGGGGGTGNDAGVGVAFDDCAAGLQGDIVQGVGELAQAAAGHGHDAALAQHPSGDEAARLPGGTELTPEAEDCAGGYDGAVQKPAGHAQVLHLAALHRLLAVGLIGAERRLVERGEGREVVGRAGWVAGRAGAAIDQPAPGPQDRDLAGEDERGQGRRLDGHGTFLKHRRPRWNRTLP